MAIKKQTREIYWQEYWEEKVQYRNSGLVLYNQFIGNKNSNPLKDTRFKGKQENTYSGDFTLGAKKRLKKTIDILLQVSTPKKLFHPILKKLVTHQLSVITLTVPDITIIHPTQLHKICLAPFIDWLTKTQKVQYYIWKMEFQKRGQIHYHITLPNIIHHKQIRDKWNYLLEKANLMEHYKKEHHHNDPNSTDIHKVYKIKCLQSYLEKEFIKSIQNTNPNKTNYTAEEQKKGYRHWDCSLNLKSKGLFTLQRTEATDEMIGELLYRENPKAKEIHTDHAIIIQFENKTIHKLIEVKSKEDYFQYLQSIKNYQRQPNERKRKTPTN